MRNIWRDLGLLEEEVKRKEAVSEVMVRLWARSAEMGSAKRTWNLRGAMLGVVPG